MLDAIIWAWWPGTWVAVAGKDEAKRPQGTPTTATGLCGRQPRAFVLPCWYRAFIDTRPAGYQTETADDLLYICEDTSGIQRDGCITAASVIGSPNPLRQMRVCAQLPRRDMVACIHGVKVQDLVGIPATNEVRVIRRCAWFRGRIATACYEWMGRVMTVTTERRACEQGARSADGPPVTFS